MNAFSLDLRQRVLAAVDAGLPRREIVQRLSVSLSTIERLVRLRRDSGHYAPQPRPGAKDASAHSNTRHWKLNCTSSRMPPWQSTASSGSTHTA